MKLPTNKFKYTLNHRLGTDQAYPLGESDLEIQWEEDREDGKRTYKKRSGTGLTLTGEVYRRLLFFEKSIYRCDTPELIIERKCTNDENLTEWVEVFRSFLSLNDATWDIDNCSVLIKFLDSDIEQCFEENKSEEFNLLNLVYPKHIVKTSTGDAVYEFQQFNKNDNISQSDEMDIGEYWDEDLTGMTEEQARAQGWKAYYHYYSYVAWNQAPEYQPPFYSYDIQRRTNWIRQKIVSDCNEVITDPSMVLIEDRCNIDNTKIYARPVPLYNYRQTNRFEENPVKETIVYYEYDYIGAGSTGTLKTEFKNGMLLNSVLVELVRVVCPQLTVKSDFFQINPDNPSSINYVTGETTKTAALMLFQKSDVKRPTDRNSATIANWTIEDLLKNLNVLFNVEWRIENGFFIIEHVSYYNRDIGLDLTTDFYKPYLKGKNKYSYKSEEIPSKEVWKIEEVFYNDFKGKPIVYNNSCVTLGKGTEKTYTLNDLTTDVEYVFQNPSSDSDKVKDEGFVLMACWNDGTGYYVITEQPILDNTARLNNTLSIAILQRDYFKYDRYLRNGKMNDVETNFITTKPLKKGETINIPFCCDLSKNFDPDNKIITPLGEGIITSAVLNTKKMELSLELSYEANINLVPNRPPVAVNDTATIYQEESIILDLLSNDSDPDEGATVMRLEIVGQPTKGVAEVLPDFKVKYTGNTGEFGNDLFTYKIYDNWGEGSNTALVSITIRKTNTAPEANNDNYSMNMNNVLNISAANGIFKNDTDDNGIILDSYQNPTDQGGNVVIQSNGSFIYTPPANFYGLDKFWYIIKDDKDLTDQAEVFITVINPDMPRAIADNYQTAEGQVFETNNSDLLKKRLTNNDISNTPLVCVAETKNTDQNGSVTINASGDFVYTPPVDFTGFDNFIYTVQNSYGTATGSVTIGVMPSIYVKLVYDNETTDTITIVCNNIGEIGGLIRKRDYYLEFYSDVNKTIPLDVTGLNLRCLINQKETIEEGNSSNVYENDFITNYLTGTRHSLGNFVYEYDQRDCGYLQVMYTRTELILKPNNGYTI